MWFEILVGGFIYLVIGFLFGAYLLSDYENTHRSGDEEIAIISIFIWPLAVLVWAVYHFREWVLKSMHRLNKAFKK